MKAQELKLELTLDKNEYLIGEPIVCILLAINKSGHDIEIKNRSFNFFHEGLGLYPILSNEIDDSSELRQTKGYPHSNYEYLLEPGDTLYHVIDLTFMYGNGFLKIETGGMGIIKSGHYSLQFELKNEKDNIETEYLSNVYQLAINEPDGKNKMLLETYYHNMRDMNLFEKLIVKNPDSPYRILFEKSLIINYYFHGKFDKIKDYFINNGSSRLLEYFLTGYHVQIINKLRNDSAFKEVLDKFGFTHLSAGITNFKLNANKYSGKKTLEAREMRRRKNEK